MGTLDKDWAGHPECSEWKESGGPGSGNHKVRFASPKIGCEDPADLTMIMIKTPHMS